MTTEQQPSDQNFRPLVYLKLMSPPDETTQFRLYTNISIPNNYTLVSSGLQPIEEDTVYTLYVQTKESLSIEPIPEFNGNLEFEYHKYSNQLNWRTTEFESRFYEGGNLVVKVIDLSPGEDVQKGKNKVVLADADDTDIKLKLGKE